ncbi:hypothetical protein GCM10025789_25910 [Tessaracoccus lubricantis]|uniref:Response regulatory domain-containing protein n=1 Tax=Tessaracoccus lubricantis TaxID=545543 RepID=A0ABP9FL05_9ACTN
MTRVLIVEDHPIFRDGLAAALDGAGAIEVVGCAGSGEEALEQVGELRPDVALMDLNLPGMSGVEATRVLCERHPAVRVLVLTMQADDESLFAAVRAGARGYLLKGAERADVVRAVEAVARGEALFGAAVAARMLTRFAAPAPAVPFPPS